jgi:hypothetical protein
MQKSPMRTEVSFPPRILCGIDCTGNPGFKTVWTPAFAGVTDFLGSGAFWNCRFFRNMKLLDSLSIRLYKKGEKSSLCEDARSMATHEIGGE